MHLNKSAGWCGRTHKCCLLYCPCTLSSCPAQCDFFFLLSNMNGDDQWCWLMMFDDDACPVLWAKNSTTFQTFQNSAEGLLPSQNCHAHTSASAPDFSCLFCLVGLLAPYTRSYVHVLTSPSSVSLFYSAAKERRTLTSSSRAPSPSSHRRTSWSSPTSTRPSSQGFPLSTRSLYTRCSVTAYEKDGEASLKKLPAHCHPLKPTASSASDHNLIKAHSKPLYVSFIHKHHSRVMICHCRLYIFDWFSTITRNNFL